jgi:hypothetical protein
MVILKPISSLKLVPATDEDWGKEYLSLEAAIKVVDSLDEALEHIDKYGSGHSEASRQQLAFLTKWMPPVSTPMPAPASPMAASLD